MCAHRTHTQKRVRFLYTHWRRVCISLTDQRIPAAALCSHVNLPFSHPCYLDKLYKLPLPPVASKDMRFRKNTCVLTGLGVCVTLYVRAACRVKGPIELQCMLKRCAHIRAYGNARVKEPLLLYFLDDLEIVLYEQESISYKLVPVNVFCVCHYILVSRILL